MAFGMQTCCGEKVRKQKRWGVARRFLCTHSLPELMVGRHCHIRVLVGEMEFEPGGGFALASNRLHPVLDKLRW